MTITLHCNLCGDEIEDVNNIVIELQHWLIIRDPKGLHEEHFCRKCKPTEEARIDAAREEVANRQENE